MVKKLTESGVRTKFVAGLRNLYRYYWPPKKLLILGKRYKGKTEDGKMRFMCDCEKCGKPLLESEVKVDHIDPVGLAPDLIAGEIGAYADRLFCGIENLQILCEECHQVKSNSENVINRQKRKELKFKFNQRELECSNSLISQAENREKCRKKR